MFVFKNIFPALLAIVLFGMATPGKAAPWLINAQQADLRSRPESVRDHFAHIESLPFDGMTITSASGSVLMNGTARSYAEISRDFAPLNGLTFTRMKHNFALVNVDHPADFFGDWSVTIENFRMFARVLREKGIEGIFFDNEEYAGALFNYPEDCSDLSKSLDEYREQARLRGRQIARAISDEFPDLVFVALHGPYSSFSDTPDEVRRGQTAWEVEEMRGPFSTGIIEGLDSLARFVDGGEIYGYRTTEDFQVSYDYRKMGIAATAAACPYISKSLRLVWPQKVGISFGVFNFPFAGEPMDPAILRTTLEHALRRCDDFVWLYCEELNWNAPGEFAQTWMDAVVGAKAAAQEPPASALPWVGITSPVVASRFNVPATIDIAATASEADGSISKVEFFSGTTKLGESSIPPYTFAWTNPAVGAYSLTAKATDNRGATTTSSAVIVTVGSAFSASINFQVAGVTAPVGYFTDIGEEFGDRGNGLSYGWNLPHSEHVRDRTDDVDRRLATLCEFRPEGVWEIAVPNGIYGVTVSIGDGTYPSTHTINAEGVNFWNAENLAAGQYRHRTLAIEVTDGRLTIDQGTAADSATRINYVIVTAASAPPSTPNRLTANSPASSSIELKWADNSSTEAGFQIRRSTHPDFSASTLLATLASDSTDYLDATVSAGTTYFYRVRATSAAGSSAFSTTESATPRMADLDGDGIPDLLESAPLTVGVDDRQIDSDGDGFSNAAEYIAETDPLDSQSRLEITRISIADTGSTGATVTLDFPTIFGPHYFVDFTDDLSGGIWTLLPGSQRTGDGTMQSVTDTAPSLARFFRLRVLK